MFDKLLGNYSAQMGRSKMKKAKGRLAALTMPDFLTRRNNDVTVRVFTVDDVNGPRYDVLAAGDATISPTTPITPTSPNNNGSSSNKTIKPPTITISPSEYLNLPQFSGVPLSIEPEPYTADSPISPNTPPFAKKTSSPQKNVPQITLKRRESGYEADLALIESRRSERSISFSSISTVSSASSSCSTASRPYSPLMHLSASQLFLADDDGRSSMSSSLTSLSGYSTAESQASGDSGISLKDRRCVSFSNFHAEFNHLEKSKYRWEKDNQTATVPSKNRLSSHSFSGATDGGHHHAEFNHLEKSKYRWEKDIQTATVPSKNRLSSHSFSGATDGGHHHRKHSGSYGDMGLHPHHACVDPLRSTRCRSVSCASLNTVANEVEFSGSAFAAKLYNRIGKKTDKSDALRNVSHVCHVYKGTLLLTDILEGKITFMGHHGRTMKEFITESGSEPWCACVTRKGHVAVTLRRQSCVTVWSGHGSLVREFGHDVLKCPTGLACDYKGRFIVTDERTNRVAIFSDTGKFIRYLGYRNTATDNSSKQGICGPDRRRRKAGVAQGPSNSSQHHAENMNEKLEADTVFLTNEEEKDSDERNCNNGHGELNGVLSVILEKSHGNDKADNGKQLQQAQSRLQRLRRRRTAEQLRNFNHEQQRRRLQTVRVLPSALRLYNQQRGKSWCPILAATRSRCFPLKETTSTLSDTTGAVTATSKFPTRIFEKLVIVSPS
ncbi:uncharacterized protein [Littorina saxatilis]|uniref:uncharacterized protein n=1 Tax=Littorina saxatilis TaxID=31220 RepID=UPI0038B64220